MEAMKKKTFQANLGHYVDSSYLLQLNTVLQITCEQKMDIISSTNHQPNIYFPPPCFCSYDVKVGKTCTKMFAAFPNRCSNLRGHSRIGI